MKCKFSKAWIGPCNKECEGDYCKEHLGKKCQVCGEQATDECSATLGPMICGFLLCSNCEECEDPNGFCKHGHKRKADPPIKLKPETIQRQIDEQAKRVAAEQRKVDDLIFQKQLLELAATSPGEQVEGEE